MAEHRDVTARLADGMPAVLTVQQYVAACAHLGYRHPDLTVHAAQMRDWYGSEEGMDLEALRHDCDALEAAASAADEAIQVQDRQRAALRGVWQGAGAAASAEFMRGHSDASATVAAALHTAREAMGVLQEKLWDAVDSKVGAVIGIEGGVAPMRAEWSAAAATVTSGSGDRAAASEVVDQAVTPFVDSVVRTDWLAAMRAAMSSVITAYQQATEDVAGARLPDFAIPGDLGPAWTAPAAPPSGDRPDEEPRSVASMPAPAPVVGSAGGVMPAPAPATVPAAWSAPTPTTPSAPAEIPSVPAESALSAMPSLGSAGQPLPGIGGGGGLSGLGQPFADALSGLLGGGGLPDPAPLDVPELDDPADTVDLEDDDADEDEDEDEDADEAPEDDAAEGPVEDPDEEPEEEPGEGLGEDAAGEPSTEPPAEPMPAPTPPPPPPPAEPLPPAADAVGDERTPCEIAADELPQVGESQPSEPGGG